MATNFTYIDDEPRRYLDPAIGEVQKGDVRSLDSDPGDGRWTVAQATTAPVRPNDSKESGE